MCLFEGHPPWRIIWVVSRRIIPSSLTLIGLEGTSYNHINPCFLTPPSFYLHQCIHASWVTLILFPCSEPQALVLPACCLLWFGCMLSGFWLTKLIAGRPKYRKKVLYSQYVITHNLLTGSKESNMLKLVPFVLVGYNITNGILFFYNWPYITGRGVLCYFAICGVSYTSRGRNFLYPRLMKSM